MTGLQMTPVPRSVDDLLTEIGEAPSGPEVGAFFDFDGTLIAGYSASAFYEDRLRRRDISPAELARSLAAGVQIALGGADVSKLMEVAVATWAGRREQELRDLFDRLFVDRIAGMIYPQARAIVKAHQRAGHTVVLASSATRYQLHALAKDLAIEDVLCTEVKLTRGRFTGSMAGAVLWGWAKADAVEAFAGGHGIDLARSFAYANGDEDIEFLSRVGRPRALNPGSRLERVARDRNWPALRLTGRGRPSVVQVVRTGAALTGLGAAGVLGAAVGVVNRDRRMGANLAAAIGPDLALALAGVSLKVSGEQNLWSHRPAVFIFNHQSSLDVAVVGSLIRRDLTGVAKKEAARDPRFAAIGYVTDIVYIDRADARQARAALAPAVERLKQGTSIAIAPEGTRSATPTVGRFKRGAFHLAMQAGVPVVPIVIRNTGELMWRRSLVIRPGTIDVEVLEPIPTADWTVRGLRRTVIEIRERFVRKLDQWEA